MSDDTDKKWWETVWDSMETFFKKFWAVIVGIISALAILTVVRSKKVAKLEGTADEQKKDIKNTGKDIKSDEKAVEKSDSSAKKKEKSYSKAKGKTDSVKKSATDVRTSREEREAKRDANAEKYFKN